MTTDTPHIDAMTMQLARFEVPETPHARSYCRAPQSDRIMELEYALIAAKESEAVWKTERDKADQRRLEAEAEVEELAIKYFDMEAACAAHIAALKRLLTTLKFLRDECDLERRTFRRVSEAINQTYQ